MKNKINSDWHRSHPMPANPAREDRVAWHAEHSSACGCRPVPPDLLADVEALKRAKPRSRV